MSYYVPSPEQVRAEKEAEKAHDMKRCLERAVEDFGLRPKLPFTCELTEALEHEDNYGTHYTYEVITRDDETLDFVAEKFRTLLEEAGWWGADDTYGPVRVQVKIVGRRWPFTPTLKAY